MTTEGHLIAWISFDVSDIMLYMYPQMQSEKGFNGIPVRILTLVNVSKNLQTLKLVVGMLYPFEFFRL